MSRKEVTYSNPIQQEMARTIPTLAIPIDLMRVSAMPDAAELKSWRRALEERIAVRFKFRLSPGETVREW